jgi:hypothetical protein
VGAPLWSTPGESAVAIGYDYREIRLRIKLLESYQYGIGCSRSGDSECECRGENHDTHSTFPVAAMQNAALNFSRYADGGRRPFWPGFAVFLLQADLNSMCSGCGYGLSRMLSRCSSAHRRVGQERKIKRAYIRC